MNKSNVSKDWGGLVLAGGLSTRMGQDKSELSLSGETLVERAVSSLKKAGSAQVIVSSNKLETKQICKAAEFSGTEREQSDNEFKLDILKDIYPNCGPLGGIHAALKQSKNDLMILPVDMVLVDDEVLKPLIARGQTTDNAIYYQDCILPLYIPFSELLLEYLEKTLSEPVKDKRLLSIKRFVSQIDAEQLSIDDDQKRKLFNVNTPEQWHQAIEMLKA